MNPELKRFEKRMGRLAFFVPIVAVIALIIIYVTTH